MGNYVIWDIMIDSNTYRVFDLGRPSSVIEFSEMFASNKLLENSWEIPHLSLFQYEGEEDKPLADFMSGFDAPVVSKKATEILRPVVKQSVEFLPVQTEVGDYFALNIRFLNCLDVAHSIVERAKSDGSVIGVDKYAFYEDRLKDVCMFRVPELGLSRLFVLDRFKKIYEQSNLTGLIFYPIPLVE